MFQWESYVSLGVLIIVIIVPRSVFTRGSSIKLYKEDKRSLVHSDPWPPAEQKLKTSCDILVDDKLFVVTNSLFTDKCLVDTKHLVSIKQICQI